MSRSFKKNAILKDGRSHKYHKKLSSSKLRADTRHIFSNLDKLEDKIFSDARIKHIINAYYICDYRSLLDTKPTMWISSWSGMRHVVKPSPKLIRKFKNK